MNGSRESPVASASPVLAGDAGVGAGVVAPHGTETREHESIDRFAALPWGATWALLLSFAALIATIAFFGVQARHGLFLYTLAILLCLLAAVTDAATMRVPNALTYPAILLGLLLNCVPVAMKLLHLGAGAAWMGATGPVQSLMGLAVCGGLGLLGALFADVGGGDAKLLAALGAMLGLSQVGAVMLAALTAALLYAVINLAVLGRLNAVARRMGYRLWELLYLRRLDFGAPPAEPGLKARVPMAVPMVVGLIAAPFVDLGHLLGVA
jgi:prepilin signal peptidase PulO-like enzyme (type II secretory pathway)